MRQWVRAPRVHAMLFLLLAVWLMEGCSLFGNSATSPTIAPDPTQPTTPTDFPAHIPLPPNVVFQAQHLAITLPINTSAVTSNLTWLWTASENAQALISFYQAQLPQNGWTDLTIEPNGDGPALGACGVSAKGASEALDIEATDSLSATDIANDPHTYTAPANGSLLIIGIIPTASCASVIGG